MKRWIAAETSTHQDHVIAHVLGASVLGNFVFDETAYLLLDIGFVWHIYLSGEMGLVPHPVAIAELEIDDAAKAELRADVDALLTDGPAAHLNRMVTMRTCLPIQGVEFLAQDDERRLLLKCDGGAIIVETSLTTREMVVMELVDASERVGPELVAVARAEEEFVRDRLQQELGRTPTETEINDWVRDHTESY
jgi:hypothetical protein